MSGLIRLIALIILSFSSGLHAAEEQSLTPDLLFKYSFEKRNVNLVSVSHVSYMDNVIEISLFEVGFRISVNRKFEIVPGLYRCRQLITNVSITMTPRCENLSAPE